MSAASVRLDRNDQLHRDLLLQRIVERNSGNNPEHPQDCAELAGIQKRRVFGVSSDSLSVRFGRIATVARRSLSGQELSVAFNRTLAYLIRAHAFSTLPPIDGVGSVHFISSPEKRTISRSSSVPVQPGQVPPSTCILTTLLSSE